MKTELIVGSFRIHFESRLRRRLFVTLCYAVFAFCDLVWCFLNPKMNRGASPEDATGAWIVAGCMLLSAVLLGVLTGLGGGLRTGGDERETHRRQHSISKAYPFIGFGIVAAVFTSSFGIPTAGPLPLAAREFLVQLTFILLMVSFFLYMTLPQAILLWTEPDMDSVQGQPD